MEQGDLLFIKGDCYPSKLIRFFLKSSYTHVTIAMDSEHICEVDIFKKMEIMKNPYVDYDLYRVNPELTDKQKEELLNFLQRKCLKSKGYDWWRIISLALQRYFGSSLVIHAQDRYICSEIIDKAYQHIGIDLVQDRVTGDVTPLDLLQSKMLVHLYRKTGKTVTSDLKESEKKSVGG